MWECVKSIILPWGTNMYHPFPILLLCHICVIGGTTNFGKCPPSPVFCFFMDDILKYPNLKHSYLFAICPPSKRKNIWIQTKRPRTKRHRGTSQHVGEVTWKREHTDEGPSPVPYSIISIFSTSSIINYCSRQVCFKFHLVDFDRVGEWVASKIKENATTDMSKKAINWTMKRAVSYFYLLQNKWRKCDSVIVCKRTMLIWASVIALSRINCNSECFYLSMSQHFQFCNFRAVYIAMSRKSVFLLFSNKFYMWEPL